MIISRRGLALAAAAAMAVTGLAACGGGGSDSSGSSGKPIVGGSITVAEQPGSKPNYIFPVTPAAQFSVYTINLFQSTMFRPLYYQTTGVQPKLDYTASVGEKPVYSDNNKKVVVNLNKAYTWSNGKPVTARDLIFDVNLMRAAVKEDPGNFGNYTPGELPDNIVSAKATGTRQVTFTLKRTVNAEWYNDNQLQLLTPLPQAAWDKTSASGKVGEYDTTPAGAKKVYDFLAKEAKNLKTYATNPLWQVVDGPFHVTGFETDGHVTLEANPKYTGPNKAKLKTVKELPFTSDAAVFNQVRSGKIDVGYIPQADFPQIPQIKRKGNTVAAQPSWGVNYVLPNFKNPKTGPIIKQLYFRQAVQHLVDEPGYIQSIYHGFGVATNGPVPAGPANPYVDATGKKALYPFDVNAAKQLLTQHGWKVVPNGVSTCQTPGSGANQCGPGVKKGAKLAFDYDYTSDSQAVTSEATALKSDAAKVGIKFNLKGKQFNDIINQDNNASDACTKSKCYEKWDFQQFGGLSFSDYPSGDVTYETGGSLNSGSYSDAHADQLIKATLYKNDPSALNAFQDYIAQQLPTFWSPNQDRVYVFKKGMGTTGDAFNALTQLSFRPELWYLTK